VATKKEEQELESGSEDFRKNLEAEKEKETKDPDDGKFVIEVAPEDPDEEPESPQPGVRDQKKAERSKARYKEQKDRAEQAAEEASALRAENERLRIQNEVTLQVSRQMQRPADESKKKDPIDQEIESIAAQQKLINLTVNAKRANGTLTQEEYDKAFEEAQSLMDRRQELVTRKAVLQHAPQQNVQQEAIMAQLRYNHPDVMNAPRQVFEWAQRDYANRLATGAPDSHATIAISMDAARQAFRMPLPNRPGPSDRTRRQFAGPSAGGHAPAGSEVKQVDMSNKGIRGMARKMYPHLPEDQAYKKWASEIVSK
jgi:hypothetical protein